MFTWSKVTQPYGVYISKTYDISNSLSRYIASIEADTVNIHNQKIDLSYSVSSDGIQWTEWSPFSTGSFDMFDNYNLGKLYFRYKVVFSSVDETRQPYLQKISFELKPFACISNEGDMLVKPKLWLRKTGGNGNIKIINHTTGQVVELDDIVDGEEVFMDCENEEMVSSRQSLGVYRFDDHNDEWLELLTGDNYLEGQGNFDMDIRYQNILLQG